jgi:hypothetical protein
MDINKIVTKRAQKTRVHFIRSLKQPTWYFIKAASDKWAYDFIVRSLHLPPHENSGFMDLEIEWAFAVECERVDENEYGDFLRTRVGNYVPDEDDGVNKWINGYGWYAFKDIDNPDKWLTDFHSFQQESKTTVSTVQITLF